MRTNIYIILSCISLAVFAQDRAFSLYNAKGKMVKYHKMIKTLTEADIIFFGEYHDNPISHWLELEVTKSVAENHKIVLGAEMFERDNQDELNAYLDGSINSQELDSTARLWNNYYTDYAPLVDFAKEKNRKFIATNIPRRNAKLVYRMGFEGLDTLSDQEKSYIAPLPIKYDSTLKCYQDMLTMMPAGHGGSNLPKAQAIKDATMAYSILENYHSGEKFIHFNGSYHSNNHQGIVWYVQQAQPELKITTITTVSQNDISALENENLNLADFIIVVDDDMTSTNR